MMDNISLFVEDNTEAEILDEMREIRGGTEYEGRKLCDQKDRECGYF